MISSSSYIALILSAIIGSILSSCFTLAIIKMFMPPPLKIASINTDKIFARQAKITAELIHYNKRVREEDIKALPHFLQNYLDALDRVAKRHNAVLMTRKCMLSKVEDYTQEVEEIVFKEGG